MRSHESPIAAIEIGALAGSSLRTAATTKSLAVFAS
jgi:hypothetical protein